MRLLARINSAVAAVLFAALTIVVALQVVSRFVLHVPLIWSEEIARFLFFWVVLLGAASSVRARRHFTIDIGLRAASERRRTRFLFDILPDLFILSFAVFLLVQGLDYTRTGLLRTATNSRVNMSLVYAAIPVFASLTIVYAAANLVQDVRAFLRDRDIEPPPPAGAE